MCKKSTAIWDYSDNNIKYIEQHYGIKNSVLIPITLSDNNKLYKNIMFNTDFNSRDIDIIIPLHQKRRTILKKQLTSMGLSCVSVWRDKLPKMVNKCKIFLNVHRDSPIASLEIHRIMDVRNVPIVLISEDSLDKDFQKKLDKVPFVNYDDICKLCYEICTNAVVWQKYVNEQIEMWKKFDSEISLQNMLEVTLK